MVAQPSIKINTTFTPEGLIVQEEIHHLQGLHDEINRQVIDTRDAQVRSALIALGWTPPGGLS